MFEAYDENKKRKVALKRTNADLKIISREFEMLEMLKGKENIVQKLDHFYSTYFSMKDKKNVVIQNTVFEFCESNLYDFIKDYNTKNEFVPMNEIKNYMK